MEGYFLIFRLILVSSSVRLDTGPWIQGPRHKGPGPGSRALALDPRPWIQGFSQQLTYRSISPCMENAHELTCGHNPVTSDTKTAVTASVTTWAHHARASQSSQLLCGVPIPGRLLFCQLPTKLGGLACTWQRWLRHWHWTQGPGSEALDPGPRIQGPGSGALKQGP